MSFTWFASAYDTDDAAYRVMPMLQMVGVLVLAAGVLTAMQRHFASVTMGHVVMRVSQVALWLRAGREHPGRRRTCQRYAVGVFVVQTLWLARLALTQERCHDIPSAERRCRFCALASFVAWR
jgi:low temperature requirement protein LtrA